MPNIADAIDEYSIYIILSLRGAHPDFHWSIFVPTKKPQGEVWHAVNRSGGWSLENKTTGGLLESISLCLALKLGTTTSKDLATVRTTLANVASSGEPSPNTNEAFDCRIWVKDAILALQSAGIVQLTKSIGSLEKFAIAQAEGNRNAVEHSIGAAKVLNDPGFSTF